MIDQYRLDFPPQRKNAICPALRLQKRVLIKKTQIWISASSGAKKRNSGPSNYRKLATGQTIFWHVRNILRFILANSATLGLTLGRMASIIIPTEVIDRVFLHRSKLSRAENGIPNREGTYLNSTDWSRIYFENDANILTLSGVCEQLRIDIQSFPSYT